MVLKHFKNTMYTYAHNPFNTLIKFQKKKNTSHTIAHLMLFTHAFCHTRYYLK